MNSVPGQGYPKNELAMAWQNRIAVSEREARALFLTRSLNGIAEILRSEAAAAWAACGAFEWVALGYLGLSGALVLIFAGNLAHPWRLLGAQALVAAIILGLCWTDRWAARDPRAARNGCPTGTQRFWHFSRHWYPHLFFLFCFEELGPPMSQPEF